MVQTTVLGYPRIGPNRELKRAVEGYWAGKQNQQSLIDTAAQLRKDTWTLLRDAELDGIPSNTFSYYDQVLDTSLLIGAVPQRFAELSGLDQYFAMARGTSGVEPMEMTKWFDTNYHYLVPELENIDSFQLSTEWNKPLAEYLEAKRLGIETRPVLVGPVTYLLLAKPANLERLESLVEVYVQLLAQLADAGCQWVQFDEPALAADRTEEELRALRSCYARLAGQASRPKILVTCSYGSMNGGLAALASTPVEGIGVDLAAGESAASVTSAAAELKDKVLYAGLVNGRNVWRTDLRAALAEAATLLGSVGELVVSTSCSLLHVPMDLDLETELDPKLRARLAFAKQKVEEVVLLGKALTNGPDAVSMPSPPAADSGRDPRVAARLSGLGQDTRRTEFAVRVKAQDNGTLPQLPTTTIGSFPQTKQIRTARADLRAGRISQEQYDTTMRAEIDSVIALQEEIGIDLLVHGEPERNDMVQYFAEQLAGYASTEHGWVQSYGSRCVRPPILHGDVSRPEPMTVDWTTYAQSRTRKPVKGMLTGPVTMLAWSFVREDQPQSETARQVALALRDEIHDLESAGIGYIQLDEPALREKLPLRVADQRDYLGWSTAAFRLATSGVADSTQIHTHMCYSEFGEIVDAIGELDADVTSVEAARSKMELVEDLRTVGYVRGIGPGVYDIHSPRVPSVAEIEESLRLALNAVEPERLWSNPDCGLKTRGYTETEAALRNMVEATRRVRETL